MNNWSNVPVRGKPRCKRCTVGYLTVDAYDESLCLNCGARPQGWVSVKAPKSGDRRHTLPGDKWQGSPGRPTLVPVTLPIFFERSSYATSGEDGRNEFHPLPERRKLMVLTYLEESFPDSRLRHSYIPVWVHPKKHEEKFEWRAYPVLCLTREFSKSFESEMGNLLSHAKEFFESEREEWLKSLRAPSTHRS